MAKKKSADSKSKENASTNVGDNAPAKKKKSQKRNKTLFQSHSKRNVKELRNKFRSGSTPKYQTPEEMEAVVQDYFDSCDEAGASYTVAGLAYHLGFAYSESLRDYEGKDDFHYIIRRAKLRIEMQRSEQLVQGQGVVAGQIFDLKCNFQWQEPAQRTEINNPDGNLGTKVTTVLPSAPLSLEEWQRWYDQMLEERKNREAINVTPEE